MRMYADSGDAEMLPAEHVDLAVEVFRMLADPTRLRLVWLMSDGEVAVGDLAARLGRNPASVSQHLAKLRMARLVATRRDGTTVFYRVENDHVARLVRDAVHSAEHASDGVPRHHRDEVTRLGERTSR